LGLGESHEVKLRGQGVYKKGRVEGDVIKKRQKTDLVKICIGKRLARMPPLDAGAVDQDADLVAVGEDARDQVGRVLRAAQVGRVDDGGPAQGTDGVARVGRGGVAL